MRFSVTWRKVVALTICATTVIALGACGSSNASSSSDYRVQPVDGVPATFNGKLPVPEDGKVYNNPHSISELKQGGAVTLSTVEIGPDFNYQNANGGSVYMNGFWNMYRPHLWITSPTGEEEVNKDFLESAKLISKDPETVEYNLNPNAKYNNGKPIDWTSFKATWEALNGKNGKFSPAATDGYSEISSVERGDNDFQVIVKFAESYYPYEGLFDFVIPEEMATPDMFNRGWIKNPHLEWGAGPFTIESRNDNQIVFVHNPKWWGKKPVLDKVTFKVMDSEASLNAFKNGEIDATGFGSANRLKSIHGMKNVQLIRNYSPSTGVYIINAKAVPDTTLRKAVFESIDVSQIAKIDYQGLDWDVKGVGSLGMYSFQKGYKNNLPKDLQNYAKGQAAKTLEAAGWKKGSDGYYAKDGKKAEIHYVVIGSSPVTKAEAGAVQSMAKSEGIKINVDYKPSSEFSKTLSSGAWDMFALGWSASNAYGYAQSACQIYCSDSDSNFAHVGSKQIDALIKQVPTVHDSMKAISLFNKAEKKALALYGNLPLTEIPDMIAVKKGLANYGPSLFASTDWAKVGWIKNSGK